MLVVCSVERCLPQLELLLKFFDTLEVLPFVFEVPRARLLLLQLKFVDKRLGHLCKCKYKYKRKRKHKRKCKCKGKRKCKWGMWGMWGVSSEL